ncbi:hypothetical protein P4132_18595 [Pseudomonas aeruginosa]|nr:hypothetical protein [Pseudomonas aeruginosa]
MITPLNHRPGNHLAHCNRIFRTTGLDKRQGLVGRQVHRRTLQGQDHRVYCTTSSSMAKVHRCHRGEEDSAETPAHQGCSSKASNAGDKDFNRADQQAEL